MPLLESPIVTSSGSVDAVSDKGAETLPESFDSLLAFCTLLEAVISKAGPLELFSLVIACCEDASTSAEAGS